MGFPAYLKNLAASVTWPAPLLVILLGLHGCHVHIVDARRFGAPCRKRTMIAMCGTGFHACLHQRRAGRKGLCSEICEPHL
eukprot:6486409-Pyramimonas_sp.AAC.1